VVFETLVDRRQILACVKGDVSGGEPVLCRMHSGSIIGDVFSSAATEGGRNLSEAIDIIERAGRGVIVYLPPRADLSVELSQLLAREAQSAPSHGPSSAPRTRPHAGTLREYGLGAQVLRALGVRHLRLLTNNPKKIAGIQGYGLDLVESLSLGSPLSGSGSP
jgi:3,4-dihydroxy 2-butanone 4-phosphate synthase/GTP cyclohydrolase II